MASGWRLPFALLALVAGCGGEGETGASGGGTAAPEGCRAGERLGADGSCLPAGLPADLPCPPGQAMDESCVPAGVPPDGCGAGFSHDGVACQPVLPPTPCGPGTYAVPGDSACRDFSDCGDAPWGDIPTAADTEHVDPSFAGASDGSASTPWTTIQAAIDAAAAGAIVAVAEGTYAEDLAIEGKAVQLWGRCAERVALVGAGASLSTLLVGAGAAGTVLRDLAITGSAVGVLASGSEDVVLERLWVHDTGDRGVDVEGSFGDTTVTLRDSLVESAAPFGVFAIGVGLLVEGTAIRDVGGDGAGLGLATYGGDPFPPTEVILRGSLIERSPAAVNVQGETIVIEDSLLRDRVGDAERTGGVIAQVPCFECGATVPSTTITGSVIENVGPVGVATLGGAVSLSRVAIRDIDAVGTWGSGVLAAQLCGQDATTTLCNPALRAQAQIEATEVSRVAGRGIHVWGSDATLDRVAVTDTPSLDMTHPFPGIGVDSICYEAEAGAVVCDADPGVRSLATIARSRIERSQGVALLVSGGDVVLERSAITDTLPNQGIFGRGIQVQDQCGVFGCLGGQTVASSLAMQATAIAGSVDFGVAVMTANATIDQSSIAATASGDNGLFGDGIVVFAFTGPASAIVTGSAVSDSARAGIASFGGSVALGDNQLTCQAFDLNGEDYGGLPYAFDNLGNNGCGCPDANAECKAQSASLTPPPPPPGGPVGL